MKKYLTINDLRNYIKSQLGYPQLEIELTDEQMNECIWDTIIKFTNVSYGDFQVEEILETNKKFEFKLLDFTNILDVLSINGRKKFNFTFNQFKRTLIIKEDVPEKVILIGYKQYTPDDVDQIFNHEWVKQYAFNKCKLLWGNILGKYSGEIISGASINYDRLISEAQSEIERLEEELKEKWTDPSPTFFY